MTQCSKCQSEMGDSAEYCPRCGTRLENGRNSASLRLRYQVIGIRDERDGTVRMVVSSFNTHRKAEECASFLLEGGTYERVEVVDSYAERDSGESNSKGRKKRRMSRIVLLLILGFAGFLLLRPWIPLVQGVKPDAVPPAVERKVP